MKNLLYTIPFLLLPFMVVAQENTIKEPVKKESANFKNQIDMDIEVLAFSFGYKRKVSKNWFVGSSVGVGPLASFNYVWEDPVIYGVGYTELMHLSLIAKRQEKNSKLSCEIESTYSVIFFPDGEGSYSLSIGTGLYYGRKVQLGAKISGGRQYSKRVPFFILGNVILRINTRW